MDFQMALTHFISFHMKVVKANKLYYSFFSFFFFLVFQLSTKALKGTTILHSKVLKLTSSVLAEWYFTYTAVSCWYVQSLAFCIWEICALHFVSVFYIIIKVGHTKICLSVVLTQCPVNSEVFRLSWFSKANGHLRDTCCRVGWRGTSITDVIFWKKKKKKRAMPIFKLLSHRSLVLLYVLRCTEMSFSMQLVRLSCREPCRVLLGGRPSLLRQ